MESFEDELKLPEDETEIFVDAVEEPPRELGIEGVSSTDLHPESPSIRQGFESIVNAVLHLEHESCSTNSTTMSSARKYYVVRGGHRPRTYLSWPECKSQVDGFGDAEHKSFKSYQEAEYYVGIAPSTVYPRVSPSSTRGWLS